MNDVEREICLNTMSIIVDTREQPTEQASKRYNSFGCPYSRAKLEFGDYAFNCDLPDGSQLYDLNRKIVPSVVIERKANIDEIAYNLSKERARFTREMERARDAGARVYLLIENASWEQIINGKYRSKMSPLALLGSLTTFSARYGLSIQFCKAETSGKLIKEILFRELKEFLKNEEI